MIESTFYQDFEVNFSATTFKKSGNTFIDQDFSELFNQNQENTPTPTPWIKGAFLDFLINHNPTSKIKKNLLKISR